MSDIINITDKDNKRLEEWSSGAGYIGYSSGQIETLNAEIYNLKEKVFGLVQLLVQHGVCSVDDILDT